MNEGDIMEIFIIVLLILVISGILGLKNTENIRFWLIMMAIGSGMLIYCLAILIFGFIEQGLATPFTIIAFFVYGVPILPLNLIIIHKIEKLDETRKYRKILLIGKIVTMIAAIVIILMWMIFVLNSLNI